jgi:phosphoribosylformimino-5-aminoimidazole carboxamide ribotide isomerase
LQVGGGITESNAQEWIDAGASKVIVTSYLFPDGCFSIERLKALSAKVGKERLVVDVRYVRGDEWNDQ